MDRRLLIKQLIFITGGALLTPSCLSSDKNVDISYKHFNLTHDQLLLISGLSETLLPLSETPEAKGNELSLFAIKMIDECSSPEEQQAFIAGLTELQQITEKKYRGYPRLTSDENTVLIANLEKQQHSENINEFYKIFKRQLISGYQNSAYFMKHVIEYRLIPSSYQVHVPVA